MNYARSQGSDNVSGKRDQSDHKSDEGVSQKKYFVITVTITSNPARDYDSTNFFCHDNVSHKHGKSDHYNDKGVHTL